MKTASILLKLAFCLSLAMVGSCAMRPLACGYSECPTYKVLEAGNAYEIRAYNPSVWMSTNPMPTPSMTQATKTGFQRLFRYIQGDNKSKTRMSMTAPVITKVTPGNSLYTIFFYLPKQYQQNPPLADDLQVQKRGTVYVAVRQFGGYVTDEGAKKELASLIASLQGTKWGGLIEKSQGKSPSYLVAGYDPPFQVFGRVNEIMIRFEL